MTRDFDIIVIGAGHAGLEACLACARLGLSVCFISQSFDNVARMSCNPAIGGLAKGNIVREIDALGGEMGLLADYAILQFRMLNKSRGSAVQSPRAQEDKYVYSKRAKEVLVSTKNVSLVEGEVVDLIVEKRAVIGVRFKDSKGIHEISSKAVVLTTGTFMNAKTFVGDVVKEEGRIGEKAAGELGGSMRKLGFNIGRLKTGTPARIARDSIDYDECEIQHTDDDIIPFSFMNDVMKASDLRFGSEDCYITFTNERTHKIINDNIHLSPLFSGLIVGRGPRYCPSIEDKVVRFSDRDRHQLFIEPEGKNSATMYLNGLSSSLPSHVQDEFIHTIKGLENCKIVKYAYAVEYDYSDPQDLFATLESKIYSNLFIAGQTNGTSGYEEAAAQGIIAGINAAMKVLKKEPIVLRRDEAYIGVLIDDLITKGTKEPYRMFTSRAEYRLSLRADTADRRLTQYAINAGLSSDKRRERFYKKCEEIKEISEFLKVHRKEIKDNHGLSNDGVIDCSRIIENYPFLKEKSKEAVETYINDIKYEGYVKRQEKSINFFRKLEDVKIKEDFDFKAVDGLSSETVEKLLKIRPRTLRQASMISGIRQSDLALLSLYIAGRIK